MRANGLRWARFGGLLILTAVVGCQSSGNDENKALYVQNKELQSQLNDANTKLKSSPDAAQVQVMQSEIAARDAKIADLQNQLRQPTAGAAADPGIAGIETSYDAKAGTITVDLPGDVLFGSGQAEIKNSAKATLNKIVAALKRDYAGKQVRVEGHTDADPIVQTKDQWDDNLDLSLHRAAAVTRYLEKQGISPKLMTTSGFGEYRPQGSNKAKNRRVEIVVVVK